MKKSLIFVLLFLVLLIPSLTFGEVIKVGLEPFPPLIKEDNTGYLIDLFRAIEKKSDLKFETQIMPFSRAVSLLEKKKVDIIAITPKGGMPPEFYKFSVDFDWGVPTANGIFTLDDKDIDLNALRKIKKLGTPRGNKEFFNEVFGIPKENFYEAAIPSLMRMLKKGRINAFFFERTATMLTIKELKLSGIHYQILPGEAVDATMSIQNTTRGKELKEKIDKLIVKYKLDNLFNVYKEVDKLPRKGVVSLSPLM